MCLLCKYFEEIELFTVGWFSVDLNRTSRVLSRFSSFLLHQKSTHASRTWNHRTPYRTDIDGSYCTSVVILLKQIVVLQLLQGLLFCILHGLLDRQVFYCTSLGFLWGFTSPTYPWFTSSGSVRKFARNMSISSQETNHVACHLEHCSFKSPSYPNIE